MQTMIQRAFLMATMFSATSGCVGEPEVGTETAAISDGCPKWGCGNSPIMIHNGIHDLSLGGAPNNEKVTIEMRQGRAVIRKDGLRYELRVEGARIRGYHFSSGALALEADELVGAEIELLQYQAPYYTIHISGVRRMIMPVGARDEVELYTMSWQDHGAAPAPEQTLCNFANPYPDPSEDKHQTEQLLGLASNETLVFEGDRYDPYGMTTEVDFDNTWFNFGCAGRLLSKLYLTRNTGPQTPWEDRQATLKMYSADYCGTGNTFTVDGTRIRWAGGQSDYYGEPEKIEARWTHKGASCLHEPRLLAQPAPTVYPDIMKSIRDVCSIPDCANLDYNDRDGASRVTGLPPSL